MYNTENQTIAVTDDCFAFDVLKDLVLQGYNGEELLEKFAVQYADIKKAINDLIKEADEIAAGKRKGYTREEVFNYSDEETTDV